ncbi:MAG: Rieske (2Fe-2S) protein [Actinomycetota bacterium]|nr:Rieske (2Fe-2S) protein [Actinomycetota bacterium]
MTTVEPEVRSRRQVLCGLMVALVAPGALAAACGGADTSTPTPTTGGQPAGPPANAGSLAAVADVPQGGGLIVDGPNGKVLLVRSSADSITAFDPTCPHAGTTVDPPQNGTITCPNHGSTFDGGTGALKAGPSPTGLKEIAVKIEQEKVVLA